MSHLVNHAVFKALLFLAAGAIIMSTHHVKDLWRLGGLGKKLTLLSLFMGMGVLSLSGIPPFSGFYSKDAVITAALLNPQTHGFISTLVTIAGVLSIGYIGRLWLLSFAGEPRDLEVHEHVTPPSRFWILLPLAIMAAATLIMGFYQEEIMVMVSGGIPHEVHIAGLLPALLGSIVFIALIVYTFYVRRLDLTAKIAAQPLMKSIHGVLLNGYYVEYMIHWVTKNIIIRSFAKTLNWADNHIVDASINSVPPLTHHIFTLFGKTHSGRVGDNSGSMVVGLLILLIALILGGIA
jgi:NADH-quinone oxidoreductase subunit L